MAQQLRETIVCKTCEIMYTLFVKAAQSFAFERSPYVTYKDLGAFVKEYLCVCVCVGVCVFVCLCRHDERETVRDTGRESARKRERKSERERDTDKQIYIERER